MVTSSTSSYSATAVAAQAPLPAWPTTLEDINLWIAHLGGLKAARISAQEAEQTMLEAKAALAAARALRVAQRKAERDAIDAAKAHIIAAKVKQAEALAEIRHLSTSFPAVMAPGAVQAQPTLEPEDPEFELIPFSHRGVNYLRVGHLRASGSPIWENSGDLWLAQAGETRGAYVGQLQADGRIDSSPDVMASEPELE